MELDHQWSFSASTYTSTLSEAAVTYESADYDSRYNYSTTIGWGSGSGEAKVAYDMADQQYQVVGPSTLLLAYSVTESATGTEYPGTLALGIDANEDLSLAAFHVGPSAWLGAITCTRD